MILMGARPKKMVSDFLFSSFLMAYQLHKAIMKEKEASSL
jgi:hypothetical protein